MNAKGNGVSLLLPGCCWELNGAPYSQRHLRIGLSGPVLILVLARWGGDPPWECGDQTCQVGSIQGYKGPKELGLRAVGCRGRVAPSHHLGPEDFLPEEGVTPGFQCRSHLWLGAMAAWGWG